MRSLCCCFKVRRNNPFLVQQEKCQRYFTLQSQRSGTEDTLTWKDIVTRNPLKRLTEHHINKHNVGKAKDKRMDEVEHIKIFFSV